MSKCPDLNRLNTREQFKILSNAVGENFAYKIWDLNNGYFINKTPEGETSQLFYNILDLVDDFDLATKIKSTFYTEQNRELRRSNPQELPTKEVVSTLTKTYLQNQEFREDTEYVRQRELELFTSQDTIYCEGICNSTAYSAYNHLIDLGFDPFYNNPTGASISVSVKSPVGNFLITHYVTAVAINGEVYIYDMPQDEFISPVKASATTMDSLPLKQTYKPRLIPLTLEDISINYNLDSADAANFIMSVLNTEVPFNLFERFGYQSFLGYIKKKLGKEANDYITHLRTVAMNNGIFKTYDNYAEGVDEYDRNFREEAAKEIFDILEEGFNIQENTEHRKYFQKLVNFTRSKLKLKVRRYLPKKDNVFDPREVVKNILTDSSLRRIDYSSIDTMLSSLAEYLNSDMFVSDVWEDYFKAYRNKQDKVKQLKEYDRVNEIMKQYLEKAKDIGMDPALDAFSLDNRYYINGILVSNSKQLGKIKTEAKKIAYLQMLGNKSPLFRHTKEASEYDVAKKNLLKHSAKLDKTKTLLLYLETHDLDTTDIYAVIENELRRREDYYKENPPQFSRTSGAPNISLERAMKQAEVLRKALPVIDTINFDYDLPVIAQLEPDGKTITLNPNKLRNDTLGHEFGHALIDLMGGMSNPFIAEGRQQLIGSKIEEEVKKNYADYTNQEVFDKEVLATAIGREVADIFGEGEEVRPKRNKFARWLIEFFRALKQMFGIQRNNAKLLAQQMVSGKQIDVSKFTPSISEIAQQSRDNIDPKDPENVKKEVEKFSDNFKLTEDEEKYVYIPTGEELDRVSTVLAEYDLSISKEKAEKSPEIQKGSKVGTVIHAIAESILKGRKINVNKISKDVNVDPSVVTKLGVIVRGIFKDYHTVSETKVGSDKANMAGTADVFAINKETGEQVIFDFKTKKKYRIDRNTGEKVYAGFTDYHKPYPSEKYSQAVKNSAQLSLYQRMFEKSLNTKEKQVIDIKDRRIVQLVVDFEELDNGKLVIKDVELEQNSPTGGIVSLPFYDQVPYIYNKRVSAQNREKDPQDISDEEIDEREGDFFEKNWEDLALSPLEQIREDAVNLIVSRLNRDRARGRTASSTQSLSDVLGYLINSEVTPEEALLQFIDNALLSINSSYKNYLQQLEKEKNGDKDAFPVGMIQRWYTIFTAYSLLDDISTAIYEGEFKDLKGKDKEKLEKFKRQLTDAIFRKNILRDQYKRRGLDVTAASLAKYSTLLAAKIREDARRRFIEENIKDRDNYTEDEWYKKANEYAELYVNEKHPNLTAETEAYLKSEMIKASRGDIGLLERWLYSAVNSPDPVVAAMLKKFSVSYHKVRKEGIRFRDDAVDILRELERQQGYTPADDPENFYSFALEHDENGRPTGYLLSNLSSKYHEAYDRLEQDIESLPYEERYKKRAKWLDENAPLNWAAYNEALSSYVDELISNGEMTEEQSKLFWTWQNQRGKKKPLLSVLEDQELADKLATWRRNNEGSFREPVEKWRSREWETLSEILKDENDPRTKFYNFIVDTIQKRDSKLPHKDRLKYQLPFLYKTGRERMLNGQSLSSIMKYKIGRYFRYLEDDATRNRSILTDENDNPLKFLPTYFKRNKEDYKVSDQSFDLASIYYFWNKMAYNYDVMSDILPEMEQVRTILENRQYAEKDSSGNLLTKSIDVLGVRNLSRKNSNSNLLQQYNDYLEALLYGNSQMYEGELNIFGLRIDKAKALNTLGKYTAYNLLGLNLMQGVNNLAYGEVQNVIEAYAGENYNLNDLRHASAYYWGNIMELMGDIGARKPGSVLGMLIEDFDVLNEYDNPQFRKSTKYAQLMQSNTAFFMSHSGEHYMQSRVFLAMLRKVQAYDKDGNHLGNMLDQYYKNEKGRLAIKPKVDLAKSNWTEEQQSIFGEKVKAVLAGIHGEFSELGWISIQKTAAGRLALMFRKYIVPGVVKRFGGLRYNERAEQWQEGSYRFAIKFWMKFIKDWKQHSYLVASANYKKLLKREKANLDRVTAEVAFTVLFAVLSTALVALAGAIPPEDDDTLYAIALNVVTYSALRTSKELQFYYFVNPFPALSILKSPAASISTIENVGDVMKQLIYDPFGKYQRADAPYEYKITKKIIKALPYTRQLHNVVNAQDLIDMMTVK